MEEISKDKLQGKILDGSEISPNEVSVESNGPSVNGQENPSDDRLRVLLLRADTLRDITRRFGKNIEESTARMADKSSGVVREYSEEELVVYNQELLKFVHRNMGILQGMMDEILREIVAITSREERELFL